MILFHHRGIVFHHRGTEGTELLFFTSVSSVPPR
ncbi:hypothetical protein Barb4_00487 [Bacteroidales bacterium Barb4]|nr:hypothetical protein Barb4_00487 [Bacteroidales bacterium Barb4]